MRQLCRLPSDADAAEVWQQTPLPHEQEWEVRQRKRETAFKLRAEDAKKWTQQRVAEELGVARETVRDWWFISNGGSAKANTARPDARLSILKGLRAEIADRVENGQPQSTVAAEFKISQGRVSKMVEWAAHE